MTRYILITFLSIKFVFFVHKTNSQIVINEVLACNTSTNVDNVNYNYVDWIELHNQSNESVNIGNWFLTDNFTNPTKWKIPFYYFIPVKGYKIFWADNLDTLNHTNFKLNTNGESLYLFNKDTILIDSITYSKQYSDISYGRVSNNKSNWQYFSTPTPNKPNITESCKNPSFATKPFFSKKAGFYNEVIEVELITNQNNNRIFYTIDGSIPNESSLQYSEPIKVTKSLTLRARAYSETKLQSQIVTRSYFINETIELPVVSISTNPDNLWGKKSGIYVKGEKFNPRKKGTENYFNNWERPVNIEYFESNGEPGFNLTAGIKIHGYSSRTFKQKTISVYFKEKYGYNNVEYPLFENRPNNFFRTILLRNSGNDWGLTMFLDAMVHTLVSTNIDIDAQAYKPAIVFLNGKYWGIHNIREKINKHYLNSNHMVDIDSVDIIESDRLTKKMVPSLGDMTEFNKLIEFVNKNNLKEERNYKKIKSIIDVNEYINYYLTQIYIANRDWPTSNYKLWKERSSDGRWRWFLFDTDLSFGRIKGYYDVNIIGALLDPAKNIAPNIAWSHNLLEELLKNNSFKNEFIQRMAVYLNTFFSKEQVISVIDSLKNNIEPEVQRNFEKWKSNMQNVSPFLLTSQNHEEWNRHIDYIKTFAYNRASFVRKNFMKEFGIKDTVLLKVKINEKKAGKIKIMGYQLKDGKYNGYMFKSIPVRLEAIPSKGYEFVEWKNIGNEKKCYIDLDKSKKLTAVFRKIDKGK